MRITLYLMLLLMSAYSKTTAQEKDRNIPCTYIHSGILVFPKNSAEFTYAIKQQLPQLIYDMLLAEKCKVVLSGAGNKNEAQQKLSQKRVEDVAQYLQWYGIKKDRLYLQYGQAGNPGHVSYRVAIMGEESHNCIPPIDINVLRAPRKTTSPSR